ncbi:hypothetical protein, partial [Streptomyces wedmorensis]|uniref:hypothetical protein n=1 Tax=Streptomyces wedmorensis TaxID=43759 RepID=UPI0012FF13A8
MRRQLLQRGARLLKAARVAGVGDRLEQLPHPVGLADHLLQASPELRGQHSLFVGGAGQDRVQGVVGAWSGLAGEELLGCRRGLGAGGVEGFGLPRQGFAARLERVRTPRPVSGGVHRTAAGQVRGFGRSRRGLRQVRGFGLPRDLAFGCPGSCARCGGALAVAGGALLDPGVEGRLQLGGALQVAALDGGLDAE